MTNNIIFLGFADNKVPEFKEVKSKDWIFFGEDNRFPEHLLYLYNKSSNHNAIINGKATYIYGKGFESGVKVVNGYGETFNQVVKKCIIDVELYGGCRVEVLWKIGGGAELRHIPFQNLRRSKELNGYWYAKDWKRYQAGEKPVFLPDFDSDNKTGAQVIAYNEYRPGTDVYPLPSYFGALNDIETDVEISKYNLSIIKNGMFSSKMITFNNGIPTEEIKAQIEKDFKKKFTGSENSGNFLLVFNNDPAKAPQVQDLSTTDLDKLFDQLNKTTQGEIFSGHQITSPMLFGIKTEGQLGGRTEILVAYELFKNTYVNEKQQNVEAFATKLGSIVGVIPGKIVPVEPIQEALNPVDFKDILPKEWVFEKLGIDLDMYPAEDPAPVQAQETNENLKNLTGRQFQQLQRVLNKYRKGQLSRSEAELLLRSSYGLCDEDIAVFLSTEDSFSADYSEEEVAAMFAARGEPKSDYIIAKSVSFDGFGIGSIEQFHQDKKSSAFADLTQVDSNIIDQIRKNKRANPEDIAEAIGSDHEYVQKRIAEMENEGVLTRSAKTLGIDTIIERAVNPEVIDYKPKAETVDVFVKYTYELRKGVKGGEILYRDGQQVTRPFCARLIELDRVYSRQEIETISQRLGYSVFDRAGGFWGSKGHCRHEWRRLLVVKRRK